MKKNLLLLAAGLVMGAAVADAATIYFENTASWNPVYVWQWGGSDATNSGTWPGTTTLQAKATTVEKDGHTYFKWETNCTSIIFTNGSGQQTSDLVVIDNMIYNASGSTGESFQGGTIEVPHTVYLAGPFTGWSSSDANYELKDEDGDGVYTISLAEFSGEFKVIRDGAWTSNAGKYENGVAQTIGEQNDNSNMSLAVALATNVVFSYKHDGGVLTVTYDGGEVDPTVYTYGLWGSFTSNTWGGVDLTFVDGKWVSDKVEVIYNDANFGIKFMENGEQIGWLAATGDNAISESGSYAVGTSNTKNFSITPGTYTFSFDPDANVLEVVKEGEIVIDYTTWYVNVLGEFNNWEDNGVNPNAEGISVHNDLNIGTKGFKVKVWNGAEDWHSNGEAIAQGEWISIPYNWDANMTIAGATEEDLFTVEFNCATNQIKVTKSGTVGVAEVEVAEEAAVYYNLQGVQVANPENGIFVKVVAGKATKVVL